MTLIEFLLKNIELPNNKCKIYIYVDRENFEHIECIRKELEECNEFLAQKYRYSLEFSNDCEIVFSVFNIGSVSRLHGGRPKYVVIDSTSYNNPDNIAALNIAAHSPSGEDGMLYIWDTLTQKLECVTVEELGQHVVVKFFEAKKNAKHNEQKYINDVLIDDMWI